MPLPLYVDPYARGMDVDLRRNNFCNSTSCWLQYQRAARVNCHQIVRNSGELSAVHDFVQDAFSR
jgi:hypothetical protein